MIDRFENTALIRLAALSCAVISVRVQQVPHSAGRAGRKIGTMHTRPSLTLAAIFAVLVYFGTAAHTARAAPTASPVATISAPTDQQA